MVSHLSQANARIVSKRAVSQKEEEDRTQAC